MTGSVAEGFRFVLLFSVSLRPLRNQALSQAGFTHFINNIQSEYCSISFAVLISPDVCSSVGIHAVMAAKTLWLHQNAALSKHSQMSCGCLQNCLLSLYCQTAKGVLIWIFCHYIKRLDYSIFGICVYVLIIGMLIEWLNRKLITGCSYDQVLYLLRYFQVKTSTASKTFEGITVGAVTSDAHVSLYRLMI